MPERDTGNLTTLGAEVKIKYVLALPPPVLRRFEAQRL